MLREEIEREREVIAAERDAFEAKKRRLREAAAAEKVSAKAERSQRAREELVERAALLAKLEEGTTEVHSGVRLWPFLRLH